MMDYKKAYYSLIERLKEAKGDADICDERYCCVIDGLIQEPDYEDERIRKAISQCVEDMRGQFEKLYSVHHKDAIAWLEKHGTPAKLSEEEQNRFAKCVLSEYPSTMPIKIAAIHKDKVAYRATTKKLEWVKMDLLRPIPITPEILERNGFERRDDLVQVLSDPEPFVWEDNEGNSMVIDWLDSYDDCESSWEGYWCISIDYHTNNVSLKNNTLYVHQLQNALALCGIEKEIEL